MVTKFKKGHVPWNKGIKRATNTGKTHFKSGNTQEKCVNWSGDKVGYHGIHHWLNKYFGRPKICELCGTEESPKFEWALRHECSYERKRENFMRLCKKCHCAYDKVNKRNWETRRANAN